MDNPGWVYPEQYPPCTPWEAFQVSQDSRFFERMPEPMLF
jgi:hypothetical protein